MKTTCCFQQSHLLCAARIIQNVKIQENEDSLMSFPHIMDILEIYAEDKCFLKSSCHLLLWGHSHDFCPLLHCSSDTPLLHSGSPFPVHSSLFYCPSKLYGRSSCQFSPVLASCVFLHFIVFKNTVFNTSLRSHLQPPRTGIHYLTTAISLPLLLSWLPTFPLPLSQPLQMWSQQS